MQKLFTVCALLCSCIPKPYPLPEQTPQPTASPSPTPKPTVEGISLPQSVPLYSPFVINYCAGPFEFNREVQIDAYPLGAMGWNSQSQCSQMIVPGLSVHGERLVTVSGAGSKVINVIKWEQTK